MEHQLLQVLTGPHVPRFVAAGDLHNVPYLVMEYVQGQTLDQAVASLGHVAEGVACAHQVLQRSQHLGIEMPITKAVVAVLQGQVSAEKAVAMLMGRDPSGESN